MQVGNMDKYERNGSLITKKLIKYIPINIFSRISAIILTLVDGIIVGNLIGEKELQATVLATPFNFINGTLTLLFSVGIATNVSLCIGRNDNKELGYIYRNTRFAIFIVSLIMLILDIPIALVMLKSYNLSPEMFSLASQYMMGLILSAAFGFINTIGDAILNSYGKVKYMLEESIVENVSNVVFDLFFICVLHMGILGAGIGTCLAVTLRTILTLYHLKKSTDLFDERSIKPNSYIKKIFKSGSTESLTVLQYGAESWFFMWLINKAVGTNGLTTYSVLSLCTTIVYVFINAVKNSITPMLGLLFGIEDGKSLQITLSKGLKFGLALTFFICIIVNIFPSQIARIYGIEQISEGTLYAVRVYILFYLCQCIVIISKAYLTSILESKKAVIIAIAKGIVTQIPIGLVLLYAFGGRAIWWLNPLSALVAAAVSVSLLLNCQKKYKKLYDKKMMLTLSLSQNDGADISERIHHFLKGRGVSDRNVTMISLMIEELTANAKRFNSKEIKIDISINFYEDYCIISMLDSGKKMDLIEEIKKGNGEASESFVIGKIADDVTYQRILEMNYTTVRVNLKQDRFLLSI